MQGHARYRNHPLVPFLPFDRIAESFSFSIKLYFLFVIQILCKDIIKSWLVGLSACYLYVKIPPPSLMTGACHLLRPASVFIDDRLLAQEIPLNVYLNEDGRCKVEIGICRGKKLYDKRDSIAKKDADRKMDRAIKESRHR